MTKRLAIIAGSENLPYYLVQSLQKENIEFIVLTVDFKLFCYLKFHGLNCRLVSITRIGEIIKILNDNSISDIIIIGKVLRPSLSWLKGLDQESKKLLTYLKNLRGGDNKLLTNITEFLEQQYSLKVLNPQIYLTELLMPSNYANLEINDEIYNMDIEFAKNYLIENSKYDIGQAVVVRNQQIIAIEAIEGTAQMLKRVKLYKNKITSYGGILVKLPKINQDLRIDLPTIGLNTVKLVIKAGLSGIVVAANKCFVIDKPKVIKLATQKEIAILAIDI